MLLPEKTRLQHLLSMMAWSAAAYLFQGRSLVDGDDPIDVLPWKMMLGLNAKDTQEGALSHGPDHLVTHGAITADMRGICRGEIKRSCLSPSEQRLLRGRSVTPRDRLREPREGFGGSSSEGGTRLGTWQLPADGTPVSSRSSGWWEKFLCKTAVTFTAQICQMVSGGDGRHTLQACTNWCRDVSDAVFHFIAFS